MNKMKLAGLGLVFLLFLPMALAVSEVELTQFNYYFYEDNFVYTVDFENTGGQEKDVNIFLAVRHKGNSTIFKADQFIFHLNEKYTEERALALDQDNYNISVISKYTDANNFEQTHIDNFLLVDIFDYFNIPFENIETPTAQQINAIQPQTLSCQPLSCPSGTVEVGSVNCDNNYCTRTCYNTTCQKQWQVISDNTGAWSTKNVPNNYNRVAFNRNLFNYTGFSTSYCYQVDTKTDNSMIATSSSSDITNYNDLDDYDSAMALVWTLENQNAQEIVAPWGGPCNNDGSGVFLDSTKHVLTDGHDTGDSFFSVQNRWSIPSSGWTGYCDTQCDSSLVPCTKNCYNNTWNFKIYGHAHLDESYDDNTPETADGACNVGLGNDQGSPVIDYITFSSNKNYWMKVWRSSLTTQSQSQMCQCDAGTCCDQSNKMFRPSSYRCSASAQTEYGCSGSGPGSDVLIRYADWNCTGSAADCNGNNAAWTSWSVYQNCNSMQSCVSGNPPTCQAYNFEPNFDVQPVDDSSV